MLARNGVQRLRLIDFDQVTLSSLNRHAAATYADVGVAKTQVVKRFIAQVAPFVDVDARVTLFDAERAGDLLSGNSDACALARPSLKTGWRPHAAPFVVAVGPCGVGPGKPDYVLDCIDNIDTKVALLKYCHEHSIRVVCAMGAGAKGDPSRIQVADLADTQGAPEQRWAAALPLSLPPACASAPPHVSGRPSLRALPGGTPICPKTFPQPIRCRGPCADASSELASTAAFLWCTRARFRT